MTSTWRQPAMAAALPATGRSIPTMSASKDGRVRRAGGARTRGGGAWTIWSPELLRRPWLAAAVSGAWWVWRPKARGRGKGYGEDPLLTRRSVLRTAGGGEGDAAVDRPAEMGRSSGRVRGKAGRPSERRPASGEEEGGRRRAMRRRAAAGKLGSLPASVRLAVQVLRRFREWENERRIGGEERLKGPFDPVRGWNRD